eukprot:CAMPEP_0114977818 /NCGR_PEP_ID=MMETSP0216-20121206/3454_1 /TAXON_ID=223996 /ORGANISM="Protocruzia adherens, Strain Boccale" /LENGTH=692 /DNA_ID=CAMNT_0002338929 /DNA_START=350 /DNA_END=2428 /DNA_ORIENTATION=-
MNHGNHKHNHGIHTFVGGNKDRDANPSDPFLSHDNFHDLLGDHPERTQMSSSGLGTDFLSSGLNASGPTDNPLFPLNQHNLEQSENWHQGGINHPIGNDHIYSREDLQGLTVLSGPREDFSAVFGSGAAVPSRDFRFADPGFSSSSIGHSYDSDTSFGFENSRSSSSCCSLSDIGSTGHLSQRERIEQAISNPEVRKKLLMYLDQLNAQPQLKFEVEGLESGKQLDGDDLKCLINSFGEVSNVHITSHCSAIVHFSSVVDAYLAFILLNGVSLDELKISFKVLWTEQSVQDHISNIASLCRIPAVSKFEVTSSTTPDRSIGLNTYSKSADHSTTSSLSSASSGLGSHNNAHEKANSSSGGSTMSADRRSNKESESGHSKKFTCRYDVQIENEENFQVARKVIGSKGSNMKRIIEQCVSNPRAAKLSEEEKRDLVKLRLRGRGSGFKEGPNKKESDEALHLCVSSKYEEIYRQACSLTESHLKNIYKEYDNYLGSQSRTSSSLTVCKSETIPKQIHRLEDLPTYAGNATSTMNTSVAANNNSMNSDHGSGSGSDSFHHHHHHHHHHYHHVNKRPGSNGSNGSSKSHRGKSAKGNAGSIGGNGTGTVITSSGGASGMTKKFDIGYFQSKKDLDDGDVSSLIEARNNARRVSDFKEADQIRNLLKARNIAVMDEKGGRGKGHEVTTWKFCHKKGQ